MNRSQKFDPPESVVGPALTELMNRLARSRTRATSEKSMSDEERKIFEYGVRERKRVLEHTLFLVFGQWALYRQGVSKLKSRALRMAYGIGAFMSTSYFIGARAKRVSHEMFATIATTATTSPLGNEARVVLAEMEGPDGPYFRKICREKGFEEDIGSVIAALDAKEGVDPTADSLHPQLRLRPRLQVGGMQHPRIEPGLRQGEERGKGGRRGWDFERERWEEGEFKGRGGKESGLRMGRARMAELERERDGIRGRELQRGHEQERGLEREKGGEWIEDRNVFVRGGRKTGGSEPDGWENREVEEKRDNLWGKPFDFTGAARSGWGAEEAGQKQADEKRGEGNNVDVFTEEKRMGQEMTPSQRRASERRMKRVRARQRVEQEDSVRDE